MQYVLATHGQLADGFVDALNLIVGTQHNLIAIGAYVDDKSLENQVDSVFETINWKEPVIVFTDLFGGSVNTEFMKRLNTYSFHLIAGVNLALLMTIILEIGDSFNADDLRDKIEISKEMIKYCNDEFEILNEDEDF